MATHRSLENESLRERIADYFNTHETGVIWSQDIFAFCNVIRCEPKSKEESCISQFIFALKKQGYIQSCDKSGPNRQYITLKHIVVSEVRLIK